MSYLLSEKHFRRYEDHIATIVNNFPLPSTFDVVPPITQADVLARNIRYAARSLHLEQWSTKINFAKFLQVWDDVIISTMATKNAVICGPQTPLFAPKLDKAFLPSLPSQSLPSISLNNPAEDLIRAVVVMHHHRYFTETSTIVTDNAELMTALEVYDVAIKREANTYTIL